MSLELMNHVRVAIRRKKNWGVSNNGKFEYIQYSFPLCAEPDKR